MRLLVYCYRLHIFLQRVRLIILIWLLCVRSSFYIVHLTKRYNTVYMNYSEMAAWTLGNWVVFPHSGLFHFYLYFCIKYSNNWTRGLCILYQLPTHKKCFFALTCKKLEAISVSIERSPEEKRIFKTCRCLYIKTYVIRSILLNIICWGITCCLKWPLIPIVKLYKVCEYFS